MAQFNLNTTKGYPMVQTVNGNKITLVHTGILAEGYELFFRLLKYKVDVINEFRPGKGNHEENANFYDVTCSIVK